MNRITPLILAVALFMEMMDSTVIATSLPAIATDIGTEPIALKLAMTAYLVALAIFIPVSGWVADRFGAKNVFRWAIVVFMLGSVACAFSNSLGNFVAARFLQGMGGSMMTPLARLVLVRSTPKNELVSAMAWLSIPALTGPLAGPPIGGFLTTYLSWHWIFWINIPIGLIGIVASSIFLPKIESSKPPPIDWLGFVLAGTTFAGILFGLSVISMPVLPPMVGVSATLVGVLAGAAYLWHARRVPHPLLDPQLFRHPMFRSAILGGIILRLGVGAQPFLLPLMLQVGFGMSPFDTGLITLWGFVGAIGAKFITEPVFSAFGFKWVSIAMATLGASSLALLGFVEATTPVWMVIVLLGFMGLFRSTFFTGINVMSFSDVEATESGQATAIVAVTQHLSIAMGVALAGGVLELLSHGAELGVAEFHTAFFIAAAVSGFSFLLFLRLPKDAGSDVSRGHRRKVRASGENADIISGK